MINIQDIIPFMKKGWVAMDKSRCWWWFSNKPVLVEDDNIVKNMWIDYTALQYRLDCFNIAPADDWTKSLIKIDNRAREKFEEEYQNNIQKTIQELKQDVE